MTSCCDSNKRTMCRNEKKNLNDMMYVNASKKVPLNFNPLK